MVDYTEGRRGNTEAHRGKAERGVAKSFLKVLPIVILWMVHISLPAQQKPDSIIVFSPYQRFLNAQAEYRGAVASGDSTQIAEKSYLMGKRYFDFGDYYEARKWLVKALKLRGEDGGSIHLAKIYGKLGVCESQEQNWTKAIEYGRAALGYSLKEDCYDKVLRGGCYLRMGGLHLETWKEKEKGGTFGAFVPSLDSAFWYYQKAEKLFADEEKQLMIAVATRFCGEVLCEAGQWEAGVDSLRKALNAFAGMGPSVIPNVVNTALVIGNAFVKRGRLREAGVWMRKAEVMTGSRPMLNYPDLVEAKKRLSDYYAKTGDWQRAYQLDQEADLIRTRETEGARTGSRESIELMHENDLKMAELEASHKELKLQHEKEEVRLLLYRIIGIALLLALAAGIFFFRLYRKYKLVSIENARLVREQSHRVKNNLQSVYNLLSLQMGQLSDPLAVAALEESLNRVDAITRVHRRLYEGDRLARVELAAYVPDLVKGVLRSYEMESAGQLYDIPEIWLHADAAIPLGLIISELTTNSCKYAFGGQPSPLLEIRCFLDAKGSFNFEYSDNGPGFDRTGAPSSFGLKLIDLLAGQLKGEYVFSGEAGSAFRLKFKEIVRKAATSSG